MAWLVLHEHTPRSCCCFPGGVGSGGHENALGVLKEFVQQPQQSTPVKKSRQHTQGMLVLILDEMDQLMSQSRSVLYELFALPQVPAFGPGCNPRSGEDCCLHSTWWGVSAENCVLAQRVLVQL